MREALNVVRRSLQFELTITSEVPNPFGYARQQMRKTSTRGHAAPSSSRIRTSRLLVAGENARLGFAAAAFPGRASRHGTVAQRSSRLCGRSARLDLRPEPVRRSMQFGSRNNPDYLLWWPNAPGGVCNGITSGFEDEHDIALMPAPQKDDPAQNWRWGNSGSRTAAGSCWRSPRRPH